MFESLHIFINDKGKKMMKNSVKVFFLLFLFTAMLASCVSLPEISGTSKSTATENALPTQMPPTVTATSPLPPTATATPVPEPIVYYYFVNIDEQAPPDGSVVIMPETYILAPERSESITGSKPAADLQTAVELALNDARNGWTSTELEILETSFRDGHANIVLQGEYFGVGDVTLITAKMQILLTVFANPAVQSATVTLNGDTIGNLGVSNSMYAYPKDYVFTRTEIEAFVAENLYMSP